MLNISSKIEATMVNVIALLVLGELREDLAKSSFVAQSMDDSNMNVLH